jgi:3-hydroxyacyl-[acyl-carrier-protein] dehydratase
MTETVSDKIYNQLSECMCEPHESKGRIYAKFSFPTTFAGFKGHFPDNPVVPGICIIQAGMLICEKWYKRNTHLKEILYAKFFSPVRPEMLIRFECIKISQKQDNHIIKIRVAGTKAPKVAEFKLRINSKKK